MEVIAINGSPRKKWNTATLLEKAIEGAASQGADTALIHLDERRKTFLPEDCRKAVELGARLATAKRQT